MDKLVERGNLYDFYGDLLTEHQQKIYSAVVFDDLSLGELSEEEGISRQGIYDLIKRCDKTLSEYDEKLKLIDRFRNIKARIDAIDKALDEDPSVDESLKARIRGELEKIIGEL